MNGSSYLIAPGGSHIDKFQMIKQLSNSRVGWGQGKKTVLPESGQHFILRIICSQTTKYGILDLDKETSQTVVILCLMVVVWFGLDFTMTKEKRCSVGGGLDSLSATLSLMPLGRLTSLYPFAVVVISYAQEKFVKLHWVLWRDQICTPMGKINFAAEWTTLFCFFTGNL